MPGDYGPDHDPETEAKAEVREWLHEWTKKLSDTQDPQEIEKTVAEVMGDYDSIVGDDEDLPLEDR